MNSIEDFLVMINKNDNPSPEVANTIVEPLRAKVLNAIEKWDYSQFYKERVSLSSYLGIRKFKEDGNYDLCNGMLNSWLPAHYYKDFQWLVHKVFIQTIILLRAIEECARTFKNTGNHKDWEVLRFVLKEFSTWQHDSSSKIAEVSRNKNISLEDYKGMLSNYNGPINGAISGKNLLGLWTDLGYKYTSEKKWFNIFR